MTGYQSKKLMAQSREDDLVKRLRAEDPECGLRHSLAMEAADYIEELLKFKMFRFAADKVALEVDQKLVNQLAAAHKRNKELETFLWEIANCVTLPAQNDIEMREIARAALGEKKDGH